MLRSKHWWYLPPLLMGGAAFVGWMLSDFPSSPEVGPVLKETPLQTAPPPSHPHSKKGGVSDSLSSKEEIPAVPKEWIFTFGNESDLNAFLYQAGKLGGRVLGIIPRLHAVRIGFDTDLQSEALLEAAAEKARSDPNFVVAAPRPSEPVADTGGPYLGFGTEALTWLGVPMDNASWGQGITVAVIDGGISPNVAISAQSLNQLDLIGGTSTDSFEHGTSVASILGGAESGPRGLIPGADLLSVRVLDANGVGDSFTTARGIMEAVDRGARVISLSLGSAGDSQVLRDAVNYAISRNVAVVAAVGNDGIEGVYFPANYPGVIAVTAVDAAGRRGEFSNFGQAVTLAAPGVGVSTPGPDNQQISFSGTSAAAPFVSGTMAMLLSKNPGLTANQAADLMVRYSDDAGAPGRDPRFGAGILNVDRLLTRNQAGIHDIALSDFYLAAPAPGSTSRMLPVVVSVQNRGTSPLSGAVLDITLDGQNRSVVLPGLPIGGVASQEILVSENSIRSTTGARIQSKVRPHGAADSNPGNNSRAMTLRLKNP